MVRLEILYEDNHLLVVNKPPGLATMGAEHGQTVHALAADYIKKAYNKPGKAYVGVVSRLDAMTSGVLVLARTSKAASRLSAQFAGRSDRGTDKIYLAAVTGSLETVQQECVDYLRKDDAAHRMRVVDSSSPQAKRAHLRYLRLVSNDNLSILAVRLLSGRKHQIRVQLADRGHPVVGDRKYGSRAFFPEGIALHSWRLRIRHPTQRNLMWFRADPPKSWKSLAARLELDGSLERRVDSALQINADDVS